MCRLVKARFRRRAAIREEEGLPARQADETSIGHGGRDNFLPPRILNDTLDESAIMRPPAMKQGNAAIPVPQGAEDRAKARQRCHDDVGNGLLRHTQNGAHFRQFPHDLKLRVRTALPHCPVRVDLMQNRCFEAAQGALSQIFKSGEEKCDNHQAPRDDERLPAPLQLRWCNYEEAPDKDEVPHEFATETFIRRARVKFEMSDHGAETRGGQNRIILRERLPDPARNAGTREETRLLRAQGGQVTQPEELADFLLHEGRQRLTLGIIEEKRIFTPLNINQLSQKFRRAVSVACPNIA